MRSAHAVTVGLALAGAVLVGPGPVGDFTASATVSRGIAAFEEPPPPPDPVPVIDNPPNAGPGNINETPPARHRRHHGDPVMGR